MKYKRFKVVGSYRFPLDMLRHDVCWPVGGNDAANIEYSMNSRNPEGYVVELAFWAVNHNSAPTEGRWASFGWHVVKDDYGNWDMEMPT